MFFLIPEIASGEARQAMRTFGARPHFDHCWLADWRGTAEQLSRRLRRLTSIRFIVCSADEDWVD